MIQPRMLYIGPLKDFSGYANAARNYIRALDHVGCDLVTRHIKYDNGDYQNTSREEALAGKDTSNVDIVLQHTTPNECQRKDGVFNILYFAWETDRVPDEWVNKINEMDLALVPCDENIRAARRCGVIIPMQKIEHTFDMEKYSNSPAPFSIPNVDNYFKFLSICQYSKKKGVDALLKAYLSEFTAEDDTVLIIKTYIGNNDGDKEKGHIPHLINAMKEILRLKSYPKILLVHNIMSDEDIERLYATSDCYVMPSRGEGWGIPCFDALGYGLPSIATGWAGPTEFITPECGWLVDYNMSPVVDMPHPHDFMYTAKDNWAEPHVCDLKKAMREAHSLWKCRKSKWRQGSATRWKAMCQNAAARVHDFDYDIVGTKMKHVILSHYRKWKRSNARQLACAV